MDDGVDGKALHQPVELFWRKLPEILRIPGPGEMPAFNALVQKQEAVALPEQAFDLGGRTSAEEEQRIRHEQLLVKAAFNDGGK